MCGLLFIDKPGLDLDACLDSLQLMQHRGPDAHGHSVIANRFFAGHVRLRIFDLDPRSDQPFWSKDRRHLIIYNGEIYNFREISAKYKLDLHTTSDTEMLLELYLLLGPRCLDELNGMFAFVILDTLTGSTFVARDRLGVKPLYCYKSGETTIFASEISPILALAGTQAISEEGMRQFRMLRTFFNGKTAFENIEMFPAGHYELDGKRHVYWKYESASQPAPQDDELRELIVSAVNYRCLSDVPVGSYLSGGLDSTLVAALCHQPDTWTVGFDSLNEFEWASIAARSIGTSNHCLAVSNEQFLETAKSMIKARREPLSVPNEVLLHLLSREIKTKNTVTLSGEGADELFFGYDRIFRWAHEAPKWDLGEFTKRYAYGSHVDLEIVESVLQPFYHHGSTIAVVAAFFQTAHLHGLLRRLDASTMAYAVEARSPFVDYRLVERMAGVSYDYRMQGGIVKAPLKRIFSDIIPESIRDREKVGFPVPLSDIFKLPPNEHNGMQHWLSFSESEFIKECI